VRQIFHRFWPYARSYRRWLALTLVFIALAPAIETLTIWLFKLLIDEVLVPRNFGLFLWIALAYLGLTLLEGLVSFGEEYLSAWIGGRFLLGLRTSFFGHLQRLSPDFFEERQLGDVIARLSSDLAAIEELLLSGVTSALSYGLRLVFFTAALFYVQWQLALVALIVSPPFWLVARYFSGLIKQASREQRRRSGSISAIAEESLANASLVQAYNREEATLARFHQENLGNFIAKLAVARLRAVFSPLIDMLQLAGVLIVVAVAIWELSQGRLTIGGLLVFLVYLNQLYSPIRGLSRLVSSVYAASASAERIIEFLDQQPLVHDPVYPVMLERARGALVFEGVSFHYPHTARDALSHISLQVEPGQTLALVGPSGAGKSTLAKLLLRFYDPSAGRILLDGIDLRDLRLYTLRQNIAVLLQETLVFDGTIQDNIAFGKPGASDREIIEAAKAADAHEFIMGLPDGYETRVGQKGRRLSGGQRQRLAIARAMIRDAPILILDEPTTSLDAESGQRILGPLQRLMAGRTTLIISHNLLTVQEADAIVVLEEGCIIERGTHQGALPRYL
jgi:ABC-type multidrug transport system fused ATPase/permease subunit